MTNITTINGYNAKNEIVATATAPYKERFAAINRIMDMPEVTHITTQTTIKKQWSTTKKVLTNKQKHDIINTE